MNRWLFLFALACNGGKTDTPTPEPEVPVDTDAAPSPTPTPDVEEPDPTPTPLPTTCDPGDEIWVQRVMPLIWGRRPHGATEVLIWTDIVQKHGRDNAVRAMIRSPEYVERWSAWFADELKISRTGDKNFSACFENPQQPLHDGSLAQFIRSEDPQTASWPSNFNMADVLRDALAADDASVIYQAHLFARMGRPVQGANVPRLEMEYNRRVSFGETFLRTYLGRDAECVACHNSTFSVTDSPDPELDRSWQLPGDAESALFGAPSYIDRDSVFAMFRYSRLVGSPFAGGDAFISPWGIDGRRCVQLRPEVSYSEDPLGVTDSLFIDTHGTTGSVWTLAQQFRTGADLLADGLEVDRENNIDGNEAFAHLVAVNLANAVWREAHGGSLTIAHDLPRTKAQQETLSHLASIVATTGFSMEALLVEVASQPLFSAGLPGSCETQPYGMERILDPWTDSEDDEAARGNGPGDLVRRHRARVLLSSVHSALNWPAPTDFGVKRDEAKLQAAVGVFMRESEPGFEGTDLQGLLSFESFYGRCAFDRPQDAITRILERADAANAPVGEVVAALRDRLLNRAALDGDEAPFIEAILGVPLTTPVADVPDLEEATRALCGAMLMSPDMHLVVEPTVPDGVPSLAEPPDVDCRVASNAMDRLGESWVCPTL